MKTAEYLAQVRQKLTKPGQPPASDYRMAKALRLSTQVMSKYILGKSIPGPVVAFRVAELLGDQPAAVIADFEAERAERDGKDEDADYLRTVTTTLRRVVSVAGTSVLLALGMGGMSNADARLAQPVSAADSTHRRKQKPKRRSWVDGLPSFAMAL